MLLHKLIHPNVGTSKLLQGQQKISHCATFIMKAEQIKSVLLSQMFLIDFYLGRSIGLKNTNLTMGSNISKGAQYTIQVNA